MSRERLEACCGRCRAPLVGECVLSVDGPVCPGCVAEVDGVPVRPSADELRSLVGVQ